MDLNLKLIDKNTKKFKNMLTKSWKKYIIKIS